MAKKPNIPQAITPKNQRIAVRVLLSILVLLVGWFLVWLYDWKDEILGIFSKKSTSGSKATGASTSGGSSNTAGTALNFFTTVKKYESAGEASFTFREESPSVLWNVVHNLSRIPTVQIFDLAGNLMHGTVSHNMEQRVNPDTNQPEWVVNTTNITFDSPQTGFAIFT